MYVCARMHMTSVQAAGVCLCVYARLLTTVNSKHTELHH